MPFATWQDAAEVLRATQADPGQSQRELAERLGVTLPDAPAPIAAAVLRAALADPLRLRTPEHPRPGQVEFLNDLINDLGDLALDELEPLDNEAQASAWIDVLLARRALRALEEYELSVGDIVDNGTDEKVGEISSFSRDGRVNIRGLWGRGIEPHRLRVRMRAGERGEEAERLRRDSDNLRARRARVDGPPSEQKVAVLAPYRVEDRIGGAELGLLRKAIEEAEDERKIQACLTAYPQLLGLLIRGSYGTFVLPQVELGAELVPDFLLAKADSAGFHWTLVELESPRAAVAIAEGARLAEKAREAVQQVEDWKNWLTNNLDYARREPGADGRGLVDIRPESDALILIGRRGDVPALSRDQLRALRERGIALHSYDWLLEAIEAGVAGGPGTPLEWEFLAERF